MDTRRGSPLARIIKGAGGKSVSVDEIKGVYCTSTLRPSLKTLAMEYGVGLSLLKKYSDLEGWDITRQGLVNSAMEDVNREIVMARAQNAKRNSDRLERLVSKACIKVEESIDKGNVSIQELLSIIKAQDDLISGLIEKNKAGAKTNAIQINVEGKTKTEIIQDIGTMSEEELDALKDNITSTYVGEEE